MVKEAKIVVEPNARLIIDGGIITSARSAGPAHEGLWRGIQVWGTTNQHQSPISHPTYQGKLELKNGGTIENAHEAVQLWKPDDWNKIGGVIVSDGGKFVNNKRSVSFMSYENFSPANPSIKVNNLSSFKNTEFIINDNYIDNKHEFKTHVTLWEVNGITFTNCKFRDDITGKIWIDGNPRHTGIGALDAGFSVVAGCSVTPSLESGCPTANVQPSSFVGFERGIDVSNSVFSRTVLIDQTNFEDNIHGIYAKDHNNLKINRNNFKVGKKTTEFTAYSVGSTRYINGVYLNNSAAYQIEENSFTQYLTYPHTSGTNIDQGGSGNNQVYKNSYTGLKHGQIFDNLNKLIAGSNGTQFICNTFNANTTSAVRTSFRGIRNLQGTLLKSAGNQFLNRISSAYDIENGGESFQYVHTGGTSLPTNNVNITYYSLATSRAHACPSSFSGSSSSSSAMAGLKPAQIQLLQDERDEVNNLLSDLKHTYHNLIDGGNTTAFKQKITNEWSDEVWKLRDKTMEKAPYLSSEAILTIAQQNKLPNAMLLEILLANVEATKATNFLAKIEEATNYNFPSYFSDIVVANWDVKDTRSFLENNIDELSTQLFQAEIKVASAHLSSNALNYDKLISFYDNTNASEFKFEQIGLLIHQQKFDEVNTLLNNLENLLTSEEIEDFKTYVSFLKSLGSRKINQLKDSEIETLKSYADQIHSSKLKNYARNILCFFYEICYEEITNSDHKKIQVTTDKSVQTNLNDVFYVMSIYPNPSTTYASIQWESYKPIINGMYKIHDLNGTLINSGNIESTVGEKIIDTRTWTNGIYIVTFENNEEVVQTTKMIIQK